MIIKFTAYCYTSLIIMPFIFICTIVETHQFTKNGKKQLRHWRVWRLIVWMKKKRKISCNHSNHSTLISNSVVTLRCSWLRAGWQSVPLLRSKTECYTSGHNSFMIIDKSFTIINMSLSRNWFLTQTCNMKPFITYYNLIYKAHSTSQYVCIVKPVSILKMKADVVVNQVW